MKNVIRVVWCVLLAGVLILGYYFYLDKRTEQVENKAAEKQDEYDLIIAKDLEHDYPPTPREVVKWYNRIITEYYAKEHTDAQLTALLERQRAILDEELLALNPADQMLSGVKQDIVEYEARNQRIVQSKVCSSNDIRFEKVKGYECAYATSYYFIHEGSEFFTQYQEFCLRKDKNGRWKILTWRMTNGDPEAFQ